MNKKIEDAKLLKSVINESKKYIHGKNNMDDITYETIIKYLSNKYDTDVRDHIESSLHSNIDMSKGDFKAHIYKIKKVSKFYCIQDIKKFFSKKYSSNCSIIIEPKVDGIMFCALFCNGKLQRILTRGNCFSGLDITNKIKNFPQNIKYKCLIEVYGELYITKQSYKRQFQSLFKSPRHALMSVISSERYIQEPNYIVHGFACKEVNIRSYEEYYKFMKINNFHTVEQYAIKMNMLNIDMSYIDKVIDLNDIPTDGAIIKIMNINNKLDTCNDYYDCICAYKKIFVMRVKITNILYSMGKNGNIIPCAAFETIQFNGIKANKISLYSCGFLSLYKISIGKFIHIKYNGVFVIDELQIEKTNNIKSVPSNCFCCKSNLYWNKRHLYCINNLCKERLSMIIKSFCSMMKIKTISTSTIKSMIFNDTIKSIKDIFEISKFKDSIILLNKIGERKFNNFVLYINNFINSMTVCDILYIVSIPGLGMKTCKLMESYLEKKYKFFNYQNNINISKSDINNMKFLNKQQKTNIDYYLSIEDNHKMINYLYKLTNYYQ